MKIYADIQHKAITREEIELAIWENRCLIVYAWNKDGQSSIVGVRLNGNRPHPTSAAAFLAGDWLGAGLGGRTFQRADSRGQCFSVWEETWTHEATIENLPTILRITEVPQWAEHLVSCSKEGVK